MEIWTAWLQGRNNAPDHVQVIFELWEYLNPKHTLHVLEQSDADKILKDLSIKQDRITPQVTTNLMRIYLLANRGGVWVDATLLPVMPLDDWLTEDLKSSGFFAFRSLGCPDLVWQNWFLYSERENYLIKSLLEIYSDYFRSLRRYPTWKRALYHLNLVDFIKFKRAIAQGDRLWHVDPSRGRENVFYPYAVLNYNLSYLIKNDKKAREIWNLTPRRNAQICSFIGWQGRDQDTDLEEFLRSMPELLSCAPLHKLDHRSPKWLDVANIVKLRLNDPTLN